ncbi:MAG: hypothetical protein KDA45_00770 [Planctomycetales bacterium]|nr:hypothetical protein [Planctomycetales bacterium]
MKKEHLAIVLILLSFSSGMVLTAATSGCDAHPSRISAQSPTLPSSDGKSLQ